ncbi:MAG: hypothetical protein WA839_08360, partial [Flavobacteriaceae bacterium]
IWVLARSGFFNKAYHLNNSYVSIFKELILSLYPVETQDTQHLLQHGISHCLVCAHLENSCGISKRSFLLGEFREITRNGSYTKTL